MASFNDYKSVVKSSGDFMTLKQGENKIRIVSEFEHFQSEYQGKMKDRFMGYVIDRTDGQIKPMTVGPQVFGQVGELSLSSEYGFSGVPPYDVIIKKVGEGMDTEYTTMPARQNTELTEAEKLLMKDLKPITDIIDRMQAKNPTKYASKDVVLPNGKVLEDKDIPVVGEDDERPNVKDLPF